MGQVVLPSVLFAAALQHLPASAVCLLFALVPALTVLWIRLVQPGTLGLLTTAGLGLALIGAFLVALDCLGTGANTSNSILGLTFIGGAVLVASLHSVFAKRHADHPMLEVVVPQIVIGALILLGPALVSQAASLRGLSPGTWAVVGYLALGVTVGPAVILWWLFRQTSAVKAALVNYLFPVVAVAVGTLWFSEPFSPGFAVGGLTLLIGVALVETAARSMDPTAAELRPCPDTGGLAGAISA
jgi:drug/metabolite transporter (DMT)-like permease